MAATPMANTLHANIMQSTGPSFARSITATNSFEVSSTFSNGLSPLNVGFILGGSPSSSCLHPNIIHLFGNPQKTPVFILYNDALFLITEPFSKNDVTCISCLCAGLKPIAVDLLHPVLIIIPVFGYSNFIFLHPKISSQPFLSFSQWPLWFLFLFSLLSEDTFFRRQLFVGGSFARRNRRSDNEDDCYTYITSGQILWCTRLVHKGDKIVLVLTSNNIKHKTYLKA